MQMFTFWTMNITYSFIDSGTIIKQTISPPVFVIIVLLLKAGTNLFQSIL